MSPWDEIKLSFIFSIIIATIYILVIWGLDIQCGMKDCI